MDIVKIMQK